MHFVETFSVQIGTSFNNALKGLDYNVRDFFDNLEFEIVIISIQDQIYKIKGFDHFVRTIVYAQKPREVKQ
jgi:hypothetical protein